jgi:hypothetical protein
MSERFQHPRAGQNGNLMGLELTKLLLHGRCHVGSLRRRRSHKWEMLGLTLFSSGEKVGENRQKA